MRLIIIITIILFTGATQMAFAKARYIVCPKKYPKIVKVPFGDAMIMEFPEKPKHALPGKRSFDFQYIGNDIAIQSLVAGSRANFYVYLGKRRCAFKLITKTSYADDVVIVTFEKEESVEVKYVR